MADFNPNVHSNELENAPDIIDVTNTESDEAVNPITTIHLDNDGKEVEANGGDDGDDDNNNGGYNEEVEDNSNDLENPIGDNELATADNNKTYTPLKENSKFKAYQKNRHWRSRGSILLRSKSVNGKRGRQQHRGKPHRVCGHV